MTAYWMYDRGQLVARNEAGALLYERPADEEHGGQLAYLLNHAPAMSRILLRHSTDELCESSPWGAYVPVNAHRLEALRSFSRASGARNRRVA